MIIAACGAACGRSTDVNLFSDDGPAILSDEHID